MPVATTAVGQRIAGRDAQAAVVHEGAAATLGDIELVHDRIVDHAGDDLALALQSQRNGEDRNAVQEIGGAIERIDDPAMGASRAVGGAGFLGQEAIARPRLGEFLDQRLLGLPVGGGDEIARPLDRHLKVLDLAEIARQRTAGLHDGGDHDVEKGRAGHG